VNLKAHIVDGKFDLTLLEKTVRTAVRMLDNVIDINFYPTEEARNSNLRHRPVGLGLMGFQDALYDLGISYSSVEAVEYADRSMEAISYFAILASTELAKERGRYPTYAKSKWERGLLPIDTIAILESERGERIEMDRSATLDWRQVRDAVKSFGMRNSNVMAIAPTATISAIIGVHQSIEPAYRNLYVKSNLSGDFTQVNGSLVEDLKSLGLWDAQMLEEIKYFDGSLKEISRLPIEIKQRYLTAFEVDPKWMIECGSRRQKWIDMGQSLNLYLADPSGKKLNDMYFAAWRAGLKTTYYLRTLAATQVEKSTLDVNRFGIQPRWMKNQSASGDIKLQREDGLSPETNTRTLPIAACPIDGSCEACQ
jgi:ribonucleoside-diphosphate reductase alpha chain